MKKELKNVRVRLAPSPTGFLHLGTARAGLFNYLFAKKYKGMFILRIEDTDTERSKKEYEQSIVDGLRWLGIEHQEGPDIDGAFGPYRQSERKEIYQKYIEKLLDEKKVYYCFCSPDELESHRQYLMSMGQPPRYSGKCRGLKQEEIEKNIKQGKPYVLRLKTPAKKLSFNDMLRDKITLDTENFGDMAVAKGPRDPLYNLACVIDDFEMKITHVIRGEDHISNTPKQILIGQALDIESPQYLHLPLILAPDRSKLSKRHGAVSLQEYEKQGYLPEAMVNFLALLGWNPGDEREIFSMKELIKEFTVEKLQKSGAVFNIAKLDWLNGHYVRNMALEKLTEACIPYLIKEGFITALWGQQEIITGAYKMPFGVIEYLITETKERVGFEYLKACVEIYQERLKKLSEIAELVDLFFKKTLEYPPELLSWKEMDKGELKASLDTSYGLLNDIKEKGWTKENISEVLTTAANGAGDRGRLLWPLRVALSGKKASAGPFEIAQVLGKKKTVQRIAQAKQKLCPVGEF